MRIRIAFRIGSTYDNLISLIEESSTIAGLNWVSVNGLLDSGFYLKSRRYEKLVVVN